jgi:hypothetical protein
MRRYIRPYFIANRDEDIEIIIDKNMIKNMRTNFKYYDDVYPISCEFPDDCKCERNLQIGDVLDDKLWENVFFYDDDFDYGFYNKIDNKIDYIKNSINKQNHLFLYSERRRRSMTMEVNQKMFINTKNLENILETCLKCKIVIDENGKEIENANSFTLKINKDSLKYFLDNKTKVKIKDFINILIIVLDNSYNTIVVLFDNILYFLGKPICNLWTIHINHIGKVDFINLKINDLDYLKVGKLSNLLKNDIILDFE